MAATGEDSHGFACVDSGVEHQAERVTRGIRVDAEVFGVRRVGQATGTERKDASLRLVDVIHLDVEMELLGMRGIRPLRWDMVRSQLHRQADTSAFQRRPVLGPVDDGDVQEG